MFILASGSPRRRELLEQIGCSFQVEPSGAKEITEAEDPVRLVVKNAEIKASATAELHPGIPVLAADTVVFMDKDIYGKPKDADDAARMLRELSGKEHNVATGMVIAAGGNLYSDASVTRVRLARLTYDEIRRYIDTGEPLDKAGAYGIQGKAAAFIEGISGSYTNVVGLPLHAFVVLARKAGIDIWQ